MVPPAVLMELQHPQAPRELTDWRHNAPKWIRECRPQQMLLGLNLDIGETEAISLAIEHADSLLIIDEVKGRSIAARHGILVIGTLGLIEEADRRGLLDFEATLQKLRTTNFRVNDKLVRPMVARVQARKMKG